MKLKSCDQTLLWSGNVFRLGFNAMRVLIFYLAQLSIFCKTLKFVANWDERDFECFLALSV